MKVRALIGYDDKLLNRFVKKGEVIEVDKERAEILLKGNYSSGYKPFVEEIVEEKPKTKRGKAKVEDPGEEKEATEEKDE